MNQSASARDLPPWDEGLQNERTALAWVRSTLALLGTALLVARIAFNYELYGGAAICAATVVFGAWTLRMIAAQRHRRSTAALHAGHPLPDGRLAAATTVFVLAVAGSALLLVSVAG